MASSTAPLETRLWDLFYATPEEEEWKRIAIKEAIELTIFSHAFADQVFITSRSYELKLLSDDIRILLGKEPLLDDR